MKESPRDAGHGHCFTSCAAPPDPGPHPAISSIPRMAVPITARTHRTRRGRITCLIVAISFACISVGSAWLPSCGRMSR